MSFWNPKVNVTVECRHPEIDSTLPSSAGKRPLVWLEPDGTLVVSDRFAQEFPAPVSGWDTPPQKVGTTLERDASTRSWRYVPETQSLGAAAKIIGRELKHYEEDMSL